jgi:hypothetical protein
LCRLAGTVTERLHQAPRPGGPTGARTLTDFRVVPTVVAQAPRVCDWAAR